MNAVRARRLLLPLLAVAGIAQASSSIAIYDIRIDGVGSGVSSVRWTPPGHLRQANASTELPGALVQHDQLQVDGSGFAQRYRLEADVQGHYTQIEVRRDADRLQVTIEQDATRSRRQFDSPQPVDVLDNNSLDGLQALLDRLGGRPRARSSIQVFVPQALAFGTLDFDAIALEHHTLGGDSRSVRAISATLTVKGKHVPLELWLDPDSGQLLRFAQPDQQVTMTLRPTPNDSGIAAAAKPASTCPHSRPIAVTAGTDRVHGELTLPSQGAGRWPALLLVAGSGALDSQEALGAAAASAGIRSQLARELACRGIAVLVEADDRASSVEAAARRVADLLNRLQRLPGVDPAQLFVAGHGDGGLIALFALTGLDPQPAGIALLDTPGEPLAKVIIRTHMAPALALGAATSLKQTLEKSAEAALMAIRASDGQQLTLSGSLADNRLAGRLAPKAGLLRGELLLDPIKLAAAVRVPLLIVQGGKDIAVQPPDADRLQHAAGHAQRIDLKDMTHDLTSSPLPALSARVSAPGSKVDPQLAPALVDWIRRQFTVRTGSRSAGE